MGFYSPPPTDPDGPFLPPGGLLNQYLRKVSDLDYDADWATVVAGEGGASYVHIQGTASTTWTINHNLGYRPSVELLDSGSQEIDADVSHPTINQTVVTLTPASAGLARLI